MPPRDPTARRGAGPTGTPQRAYQTLAKFDQDSVQKSLNKIQDWVFQSTSRTVMICFSADGGLAVGKSVAPPVIITEGYTGFPLGVYIALAPGEALTANLSVDVTVNTAPATQQPLILGPGNVKVLMEPAVFNQPDTVLAVGDLVSINVNAVNAADVGVKLEVQLKLQFVDTSAK